MSERENIKTSNPGFSVVDISKKAGELWKGLTAEDKKVKYYPTIIIDNCLKINCLSSWLLIVKEHVNNSSHKFTRWFHDKINPTLCQSTAKC
jgi:hypothetical protein